MANSKYYSFIFLLAALSACYNDSYTPIEKKEQDYQSYEPLINNKYLLWPYYFPDAFLEYLYYQQIVTIDTQAFYPNSFLLKNQVGDSLYYIGTKKHPNSSFTFDTTSTTNRYEFKAAIVVADLESYSIFNNVTPPSNYRMKKGETYTFVFISNYDSTTTFAERSFVYDGAYSVGFEINNIDRLETKVHAYKSIYSSSGEDDEYRKLESYLGTSICFYFDSWDVSTRKLCNQFDSCVREAKRYYMPPYCVKQYYFNGRLDKVLDTIWDSPSNTKALDMKKEFDKSKAIFKAITKEKYIPECKKCLLNFFEQL